jgi:hypothetical protein
MDAAQWLKKHVEFYLPTFNFRLLVEENKVGMRWKHNVGLAEILDAYAVHKLTEQQAEGTVRGWCKWHNVPLDKNGRCESASLVQREGKYAMALNFSRKCG